MLPPGVPLDRVAAMRKALSDTFNDPAFESESEKIGLTVNAPQTGEQLQKVIDDAYRTPTRVVERLRALNNP
jgi:tripartite-type tricarboxylate transporter receptor subunit TctC